jgi:drug/metabolite transporter (DMT)-like permease
MLFGLDAYVEIFNPDPSIYEDEDANSGIYLSLFVFSIIVGRYSYLAMEQKTFKASYEEKEKDGTKAWIKSLVLFAFLTTCFDLMTGYYISSSGMNYLSQLWYFLSAFIAWYFFGRKYFNPLSNWKFFK